MHAKRQLPLGNFSQDDRTTYSLSRQARCHSICENSSECKQEIYFLFLYCPVNSTNLSHPPDQPVTQTINVVYYKPKPDSPQKIQENAQVSRANRKRPDKDWRKEVAIFNSYMQHKDTLIDLLSVFLTMWDGHLW